MKVRRRVGALAAGAILLLGCISLAAPAKLTLEQAVALALEKNPARKAVVFEQRIAAAEFKLSRAPLLPRIGFSETYQDGNDPVYVFGGKLRQQRFTTADFDLNQLNTPTPFSNYVTRFSGQWQLFDSGANWRRLMQAKQATELARRKLDRTDQELLLRVVDAYIGELLAKRQVEVAQDAEKSAQSALDRARANVEAGMSVESDLLSAQVNHAARRQELIRAQNDVSIAAARLTYELGVPADTGYELGEVLADRGFPAEPLEQLEARALDRRPDLRGLALQQSIQQNSVTIAKAAFGPTVNAVGNWEADNPRFGGGGGNDWMFGLEVRLDLFDGGARVAQLQRERALKQKVDALRESAASGVRLEVRKAYFDYDAARRQLEVARTAVAQAAESLRIGHDRYDAGLNTITDLLRMEEADVRAKTDYWQAVYRVQSSYASLELATGTLNPDSPVVKQ
ncbi:MAG: TolC family protein [Terriglobales bacterium]